MRTLRILHVPSTFCVRPWAETKSWHFGLSTKKPGLERVETHREGWDGTPGRVYSVSREAEVLGTMKGCGRWWKDHRDGWEGRSQVLRVVFRLLGVESSVK